MKVIIVDDDITALNGLQTLVNWSNANATVVATATDGLIAIELIKEHKPNVVISDIKMNKLDGIGVCKFIYENMPNTKIILVSGHSEFEYAQNAIKYGVSNYLIKPFTRSKIYELEEILSKLSKGFEAETESFLYFWSVTLKDEITSSLLSNDIVRMHNILKSDNIAMHFKGTSANMFGVQLLNFLYLYQAELNMNEELLQKQKSADIQTFCSIVNNDEKFDFVVERYITMMNSVSAMKSDYTEPVIAGAVGLIEQHYTEADFNITTLADELHISPQYLSTAFKEALGVTPSSYIANKRLQKAKEYLADVRIPINEVALKCGFIDAKYFSKFFKKNTDLTPSEYRNIAYKK